MSAADGLPRVWVTRRRVYIQWPQWRCEGAKPTAVINLGSYLDDIVAWPQRVPADAVELNRHPPAVIDAANRIAAIVKADPEAGRGVSDALDVVLTHLLGHDPEAL